jgi:hypothetical protein
MLDLMQVAAYARICMHTNACAVREVERTLMYQHIKQVHSISDSNTEENSLHQKRLLLPTCPTNGYAPVPHRILTISCEEPTRDLSRKGLHATCYVIV